MNRKEFALGTLIPLVLLTLAFIPLSSQQGGGTYDPWLDYNEDGKIDVAELHPLGQAYGSTGDPTKNVTIGGHKTNLLKLAYGVSIPSGGIWDSGYFWIDGYAKITVLIGLGGSTTNYLSLYACDYTGLGFLLEHVENFQGSGFGFVKTYDVMNQQMIINVWNGEAGARILYVDVYLMA